MNLMSAVLVNLWAAGWILAAVREVVRARAAAVAQPSRKGPFPESSQ